MKATLLTLATLAALTSLYAEDIQRPPINPALLYWQSAAQLPNLSTEQVSDLRNIASGKKSVTAAQWKNFGLESAEKTLLKAAESTAPCDWGLLWELGPETPMPHTSKIMELANIAIGEAELQLTRGEVAQGQQWLITAHRMARHAGSDDILISYLIQSSIEQNTLRCAARHCLAWDTKARQTYQSQLKQLPALHNLQQSFEGENRLTAWLDHLNNLPQTERASALQDLFAGIPTGKDANGSPIVQRSEIVALQDREKLAKALSDLRDAHKKTYNILGKPWKTAFTELTAQAESIKSEGSVLVRLVEPVVTSILNRASSAATLHTMLDAGLQYGSQLDAAHAAEYHDSFEGLPLKIKKDSDGSITLQCATVPPGSKLTDLRLSK